MEDLRQALKRILENHNGRAQAIASRLLTELTGAPDRSIRMAIEDLITDGLPVVSATDAPAGYFIPANMDEAREYTKSLCSRAVVIFLRRKRVIKNAGRYLAPASQGRLI